MIVIILVLVLSLTVSGFVSTPSKIHCKKWDTYHCKKWDTNTRYGNSICKANSIKLFNNRNSIVDVNNDEDPEPLFSPRRLSYLALWLSLVSYAFTIAPGGSEAATAIDNQMIQTIIQTPSDGTVSPVFTALFNSLGIIPAIYASILLPGANDKQKVPGLLFVLASFALGFFGVGPYLGLRRINVDVTDSNKGRGSFIFENKLTALGSLLFGIYLVYFAFTAPFEGDRWMSYFELFQNQKLAHVSTIDFTILSIAMSEPMKEDMDRREWTGPSATAFCAVPVFGPVLYLLLRPSLRK